MMIVYYFIIISIVKLVIIIILYGLFFTKLISLVLSNQNQNVTDGFL